MKNFPVIDKETGREYWISRSVAVVVGVFTKDSFLVVQRGTGTPDPEFVGKYCMPCGYLDFDETCVQAAKRELFEETGLSLPEHYFELASINDEPDKDKRQNITFRYIVKLALPTKDVESMLSTKHSEENEVSSIKFINIKDIDKYEYAFNHNDLIKKLWQESKIN